MTVTSYFANHRKLKEVGFEVVSIARFPPGSCKGIPDFAPPEDLVRGSKSGTLSEEDYKACYIKMLDSIPVSRALELVRILKEGNYALCCFCGKDKFCHRHLLADWLNRNFELNIKEF